MEVIRAKLTRNLRKSILQGSPWVYQDAVHVDAGATVGLCKLHDSKNNFLAWGMYDPNSPLAVRVISIKEKPDYQNFFERRFQEALQLRSAIRSNDNNCFRLINGEGDLLPGLVCDVYGKVAVIQFDGEGPFHFWDQDWIANWLLQNTECSTVYLKPRHDSLIKQKIWGEALTTNEVIAKENSVQFFVDIVNGQKTGFFLDQRDNRNYIREISRGKSVANLFCYSGGFSVYAGMGGASKVLSVDISEGALILAQKNWELNGLDPSKHETLCTDVFEFSFEKNEKFDVVICDPPSLAKSEKHKPSAIQKYIDTFSTVSKAVKPGGHLVLSSCSSHVSFNDFEDIYISALSKARLRGQVLKVGGQGIDHPFPHACPHLRYLKFVDLIVQP